MEVEVRHDEDQITKEEETLALLLTAGYFRARIRGLSTFDKIIGGMSWCIQGCNVDLDIDLLYNENANIGRKIALTERIVRALQQMRCPYTVVPHQIQGNDFVHIYPVLQWLVKQAIGSRDARVHRMRRQAVSQFERSVLVNCDNVVLEQQKQEQLHQEKDLWLTTPQEPSLLTKVQEQYKPVRRYRKPERVREHPEERVRVHTTLMEYSGRMLNSFQSGSEATGGGKSRGVDSQQQQEAKQQEMEQTAAMEGILSDMAQTKQRTRIGNRAVGNILVQQSSDMQNMLQEYQEEMEKLSEFRRSVMMQNPQNLQKMADSLKEQLEALRRQQVELEKEVQEKRRSVADAQNRRQEQQERETQLQREVDEVTRLTEENLYLRALEELLQTHEALKKEETTFKADCKKQMATMQEEIRVLQEGGGAPEENEERMRRLQGEWEDARHNLQNTRTALATLSQQSNRLEREIDQVPSQWEVQQYQLRFMELGHQLDAAFRENKQLCATYNTEVAIRDCLQREVDLLNSIHDNLEKLQKNQVNRDDFLKQMEKIAQSLYDVKQSTENQLTLAKASRDQSKEQYTQLLELERQYAREVKEFQETCKKFEALSQRSEELGISSVMTTNQQQQAPL